MRFLFAMVLLAAACVAQQNPSTAPNQPAPAPTEPAKVSGRTTNLSGQAVRKTRLTLIQSIGASGEQPKSYGATSDAEGRFVFESVDPGQYRLWAEKAGFLRQAYGAKQTPMAGTTITLTAGQQLTDLAFILTPQSTITGKVLDEDGEPVPRSQVRVMRPMYRNGKRSIVTAGSNMADESGEFKISNLAAGRYYLCATPGRTMFDNATKATADPKKPEEALVNSCYPNAADTASAALVDVVAGHDLPGMDIHLHKAPVVRVKGKLSGGAPGQRLQVNLSPHDPGGMLGASGGSSSIGKDGDFEIRHVQPGSYDLTVMSTEGMWQVLARQRLEVGSETVEGVVLTATPPADLKGVVKIEGTPPASQTASGTTAQQQQATPPPPSTSVTLSAIDGIMFSMPRGQPGADGAFTLANIGPGKYRVYVSGTPDGAYLKSIKYADQEVLATGADLSSGVAGGLEVIFKYGAAEVNGTVKDDHGQVAAGGTITLIPDPPQPEQNHLYHQTAADQNGQFTFKNLAPGAYRVYAWENLDFGAQFDPDYLKPHSSLSVRLDLSENSHEQVNLVRISGEAASVGGH